MNSSFEALPPNPGSYCGRSSLAAPVYSNGSETGRVSCVPMAYRDAAAGQAELEEKPPQPAAAKPAVPVPNQAEIFAARLELERTAIVAQARQEAEREIARARAAVAKSLEHFARQRDEYFHQAEGEIVDLALAIARRILHRECQVDRQLLSGLVHHELEHLEGATGVRLAVSPDKLNEWSETVRAVSRPVELVADKSLSSGEARIETALGSTTVSFERELKEIERGFFDLLSRRPAAASAQADSVQ